jgi:transcriptional regulator with XRE-family HTH domain
MDRQEKWLKDFGARLKAERIKQRLTQQALAAKAGTKQDYIAQIERGIRNPTLRTLLNILAALDISADQLIYGVDDLAAARNEAKDDTSAAFKEFTDFLARRDAEDVVAYYEICRFLARYVEAE